MQHYTEHTYTRCRTTHYSASLYCIRMAYSSQRTPTKITNVRNIRTIVDLDGIVSQTKFLT